MRQAQFPYRRSFFHDNFTPGVKWLLIVNSAIFVIYWIGGQALQKIAITLLALIPVAVVDNFYIWQPFTYMFLHASIGHIVLNMLALYFFGSPLEMVDEEKQRRLRQAADAWLERHPGTESPEVSFEVIALRNGRLERLAEAF